MHFYLILMHRMEVSGITAPGPDYMAYAKNAGLESPHLSIAVDALQGTMFFLDEVPWRETSPLKVRQAIKQSQTGALDKELEQSLDEFLRLVRRIRENSITLRILDITTGAQHFAWKGPKEQ